MYKFILISFVFAIMFGCNKKQEKPMNVLMIFVDDLRPELGCYGNDLVQSPNIDKLANEGVLFKNNFCNIPVCGASRASLMTGARPTRNRFVNYFANSEIEFPEGVCLSQHFKNNGYYTISNGKVFHNFNDRADSWDENWRPVTGKTWRDYHIDENIELELNGGGPPYENADVPDTTYHDGKVAEKTIADLKKLKEQGKPFFLASGFVKPHLPFIAPKKYWDLYDINSFKPTKQEFWPANAPDEAFHDSGELRAYNSIPAKGFVSDSMSVMLQYGYNACVSYTDAQVGKILQALDELGLSENTVVILFGDHGWNLGDHGMWCKHCNFNTSLQAPLIIKAPQKFIKGKTKAMTEFIDLYPTLCDLCDLEIPETVEGKSLVPLLDNPQAEWTDYVICKFHDGLTIRTQKYAYTEWRNENDSLISNMLYDHVNDVDETNNISNNPENKALVKQLKEKMFAERGADYFKPNASSSKLDH